MKHKQILFIHSSSDLYGASKIGIEIVEALLEAGHQVMVVLPEQGPLVDRFRTLGIEIFIRDIGILRRQYFNPFGIINRLWTLSISIFWILRLMRKHEISLVYSNTLAILAGSIAARIGGCKHVFHAHEILEDPRWFGPFIGKIIKATSQGVLVVSNAVKEFLKPQVSKVPLHLIHNGLDYSPFASETHTLHQELSIPEGRLVIGVVGRIHPWKGQDYFVDIANHLLHAGIDAQFLIVGDVFPGNEYVYDDLKKKIAESIKPERFSLLNFRKDIPAVMKTMDIFISPSVNPDPLPTVILEAMAAGVPVVATAHGGAPEMVIDHETGLLIPPDDAEKAAVSIVAVAQSASQRSAMGQAAGKRVNTHFSQKAFRSRLGSIIDQI